MNRKQKRAAPWPVWQALSALAVAALIGQVAAAETPRHPIVGRLLYDGPPPEPVAIDPGRDACCLAAKPIDESLVVGPGGGLANAVVSIEPRWGEPRPAPPEGDAPPAEPVRLTNAGCAFRPRVAVVRVGQPLVLENSDPTMHNVEARLPGADRFNLVLAPDSQRDLLLAAAQRKPLPVGCNVHPFMRAWLFVRDDPFFAVTGPEGRFAIEGVPPGEWRLQFWREGAPLAGVEVGGTVTDARGTLLVTLGAGPLDLGDARVGAAQAP